jgi:hypothetical protein
VSAAPDLLAPFCQQLGNVKTPYLLFCGTHSTVGSWPWYFKTRP